MINIFFFQAEDGIRDKLVTGVQTCALPIYCRRGLKKKDRQGYNRHRWFAECSEFRRSRCRRMFGPKLCFQLRLIGPPKNPSRRRSEERRVGKESRAEWGGDGEEEKEAVGRG